ncbi:MAG: 16S rRNA (cytidine(1402)-2'-O)-methyltransferase [Peredibacter sp.]
MSKVIGLVTTPIGNLEDIGKRAHEALVKADLIIAEDTRVTRKLLDLLEIKGSDKTFYAFHEHNQQSVQEILKACEEATSPVLVSDAGSPILSDPGYPLIKAWTERGHDLLSYPGPSAVTMALELSGLPPLPFEFQGFLPRKDEAIKKVIEAIEVGKSTIFFESPHRIEQTLDLISQIDPLLQCFVGRELTKKFEEHFRFKASEWPKYKENFKSKGEFVLVLFREGEKAGPVSDLLPLAEKYLQKPSTKGMAKLLSAITGEKTSVIYDKISRK